MRQGIKKSRVSGKLVRDLNECTWSNIRKGSVSVGTWMASQTSKPKEQHQRHSFSTAPQQSLSHQDLDPQDAEFPQGSPCWTLV